MRFHRMTVLAAALSAAPAFAQEAPQARVDVEGLGEVYFAFDSARVTDEFGDELDAMAERARQHEGKIVLDGHADPRGTNPYNVGLALRRAESVRDELVERGVPNEKILIVTYGEDGLRRQSYRLDRRVSVWATEAPLYAIIDRSLVRGTAVLWDEPVTAAEIDGPRATDEVAIR